MTIRNVGTNQAAGTGSTPTRAAEAPQGARKVEPPEKDAATAALAAAGTPTDSFGARPVAGIPPRPPAPEGLPSNANVALWGGEGGTTGLHVPKLEQYDPAGPGAAKNLFIPDYRASHEQFLKDAAEVDARLKTAGHPGATIRSIPVPDPEGGPDRFIDVLDIKATRAPERAVVMTTGIHGPEAAYGAAVARSVLGRLDQFDFSNTSLTLIGPCNPYGWEKTIRENEQHLDLNRSNPELRPGDNPAEIYGVGNAAAAKVDGWIKLSGKSGSMAAAGVQLAAALGGGLLTRKFSSADLANALGWGQTEVKDAPAYADLTQSSPELAAVNPILRDVVGRTTQAVVHFDVHSGVEGEVSLGDELTGKDRLTVGYWSSLGQAPRDHDFMETLLVNRGSALKSDGNNPDDVKYQNVADTPYAVQKMARGSEETLVAAFTYEQATLPSVELPLALVARMNQYRGLTNGWKSPEARAETEEFLRNAFLPMKDAAWVNGATRNLVEANDMLGHFLADDWKK